ncbi:MAG: sporulation protein YtfJ [Oscillospiraceae bacterium]|nr:sporulation protein YtfJ [Oscillospiraceae bacterium]MCH5189225.1 sporulation protein YtfJ [Oscillospiraceae bacterium]
MKDKSSSAAGILESTIEKVKDLVNVSTIIGEPISAQGGVSIIPVSKVTYGFASGGSDFPSKSNQEIFGGGGGAGVTITPVAFLVIDKYGNVEIKHITAFDNAAERMVSLVPEMFDKVNVAINKAKMDKAFDKAVADIAVTAEENIEETAE